MTGLFFFGFGASLIASLLLTKVVRDFALRKGWQAVPTEARHVHRGPIPRFGGVAVYLSQVATFGTLSIVFMIRHARTPQRTVFELFLPATLVFLVGLCDDLLNLSARTKILSQVIAATLVYAMGLRIDTLGLLKHGEFGALSSFLLTVGWILLITNAFNLIDGLDGLAAGSAAFSALVLFVVVLTSHALWVALFAISISGATIGFLYFNFNPASIFLGDCGSLFIGFSLAVLSLASSQKAPTMVAVGMPVVCFGLPILDVVMSVLRRFLSGRCLFEADCEHIHHRLLLNGLSHRTAVLVLYGISAFFGLLSLALLHRNGPILALVLGVLGCGVVLFVAHLGYHEVDELRRVALRTVTQRNVISHNLRFRRAGEMLRKCGTVSEIESVLVETFASSPFDAFELFWRTAAAGPNDGPFLLQDFEDRPLLNHVVKWARNPSRPFGTWAWQLELALFDVKGRHQGTLSIARDSVTGPLPVDINLFTEHFQAALTEGMNNCFVNCVPAKLAGDLGTRVKTNKYSAAKG